MKSTDPIQPSHCAEMLGALAAPERLRIIRLLHDGPRHVNGIADALDMPAVNLAHHLNVLRQAGLVRSQKHGRFVDYSIVDGVLEPEGASEHFNLGCCRLELPPPRR